VATTLQQVGQNIATVFVVFDQKNFHSILQSTRRAQARVSIRQKMNLEAGTQEILIRKAGRNGCEATAGLSKQEKLSGGRAEFRGNLPALPLARLR
jgi:hypothetical protein